ncbi:Uma2 family endonuclease [Streptomyces sp. NBC_01136]|uniref:Uma2 family endonuclease n=1 Tax=Streptomyces sp. NBC_01136 TaxID=2903754 RepID=UPI00386EE37E|nr:Uma2 family endonuclease [Streptomyces sp. NBC_01136]
MGIVFIATPGTEPLQDPIDLLATLEEAAAAPMRPEYVAETVIVPRMPDDGHSHGACELSFQLHSAGVVHTGMGNGYRVADENGDTTALLIPDFYVRRRKATELDESYRETHKGWYPIDMIALVGEVTSTNHWTDTGPKLHTYAAAGVPVYVLINRNAKTAHCYTDPIPPGDDAPTGAYYDSEIKVDLGHPLPLPAPYPALDTAAFLETAD